MNHGPDWGWWPAVKDYVLPWLPIAATLAGWWVVNLQANKREARKEERALIDSAKKLAIETSGKARTYMCTNARCEDVEAEIKLLLDQLEIELTRLPGYASDGELVDAMGRFANAATGADFESAERRARTPSDPEPQELAAARNELLRRLEAPFARRYPA